MLIEIIGKQLSVPLRTMIYPRKIIPSHGHIRKKRISGPIVHVRTRLVFVVRMIYAHTWRKAYVTTESRHTMQTIG